MWSQFLSQYSTQGQDDITNTRIGSRTLQIHGGKYSIPHDKYLTFLELHKQLVLSGEREYMTEKQLDEQGPILVDIDFRFALSQTERWYGPSHIDDLLDIYLEEIQDLFYLDDTTKIPIYIFEKDTPNRLADKVKDGIHLVFSVLVSHTLQMVLRERVLAKISNAWGDCPLINTWEQVFDAGITAGTTNWQLYGSCKPDTKPYVLTAIKQIGFDADAQEFVFETTTVRPPMASLSAADLYALSARCRTGQPLRPKTQVVASPAAAAAVITPPAATATGFTLVNHEEMLQALFKVRTRDEVRVLYDAFYRQLSPLNYDLVETCEYTMILPSQYYTDYNLWIRVGWALCNISRSLFLLWMHFSAQWDRFNVRDIRDFYDRWCHFNTNRSRGLTRRSIMHWAKMDNFASYTQIRRNSIEYYINETLKQTKCSDWDIARILYEFYKDEFVCVSIRSDAWYKFENHRWKLTECGTTLRKHISVELRDIYKDLLERKMLLNRSLPASPDAKKPTPEQEQCVTECNKLQDIITKLGRTTDKDHIMKEAKELFYDDTFIKQLDEDPYLICFNNGVYDFRNNVFRPGRPEDCLSKCTHNSYIPSSNFTAEQKKYVAEIHQYMERLYPLPDVRAYMWEHLASTLLGNSAVQTFNVYIGKGRNGKSVLTKFMSVILGDYYGEVPLSLITEKRVAVGGLSPEIVKLKGVRYAVMQEPSRGQRMNEGVMKQLTSGQDKIIGRAPYMVEMVEFYPQFKMVMCTNEFFKDTSLDYGTWRRIRIVDHVALFTENPVEGDLEKPYQYKIITDAEMETNINNWKEIFLSLLMDIAIEKKGNVTDCPSVLAASNEYKNEQDYIGTFMSEYVVADPNGQIHKRDLKYMFNKWFSELYGEKGCPNIKDVYVRFNNKYGKTNASQPWRGVALRHTEETLEIDGDLSEFAVVP